MIPTVLFVPCRHIPSTQLTLYWMLRKLILQNGCSRQYATTGNEYVKRNNAAITDCTIKPMFAVACQGS